MTMKIIDLIKKHQQQFYFMKQQLLSQTCILVTFFLLFGLASCQAQPHIHKLPLKLTSNYVYYADLYFGSNGQNISLLVDTGSKTLAAFCSLCVKGCEVAEEFQIESSPTFGNITCEVIDELLKQPNLPPALKVCKSSCRVLEPNDKSQCKGQLNYGSSSLASFLDYLLIRDLISVNNGDIKVYSSFGCIYDERNFDTGIWGLALSPDNQLLNAIHSTDQERGYSKAQKIFTICTTGTTSIMNIGGVDTSYHIGDGYTMRINPYYNLWWNINIQDLGEIKYSDTVLRNNNQNFGHYGIILDSGTDFIILPGVIVNKIMDIAQNICGKVAGCTKIHPYEIFNIVFNLTNPSEYFSGKFITFTLGGKKLQTPLSNYFWNLGNGGWALAVVSAQRFNFEISILGSIWMNNFDISFDRENERITIYDITGCEATSRRLQTEDGDDYDQPQVRGDRLDGVDAINKLKMKHQRGITRMMSENIDE